ncbi:MAG: cytochrome P450 [Nitriliruptoraceae bacterium]|nr:cytochrome P450 [Nitriliruptoraceae bacterium]
MPETPATPGTTGTRPTAPSLGFDPDDAAFVADPYPVYDRMRATGTALAYPANDWWLVTRHDQVNAMLRHRALGRVFVPKEPYERFAPWNLVNEHAMLELEPPDHTRLRRLVSKAFTPRRVEELRPAIRARTESLVDDLVGAGGGAFVDRVAEPLPVDVIGELLGIDPIDRALLRPWSNAIVALYEPSPDAGVEDAAIRAAAEFTTYLRALIEQRRRAPGEDLFSALVGVRDDGDRLTEDELVATAVLLLNAGHEASVNVLSNAVAHLLLERARWEAVVADPTLVPTAIEEAIRFDTPLSVFTRVAAEDVTIEGIDLAAGQQVGLLLGAANRDPAVFAEADRFEVGRSHNPHVGFGAGIHFCLGAALARVELQEALGTLVRRAPGLELADEPVRRDSYQFRGFSSVPVTVG